MEPEERAYNEQLLQKLLGENVEAARAAFTILWKRYSHIPYAIIKKKFPKHAEDMLQDVAMLSWRRLRNHNLTTLVFTQTNDFERYLCVIASNQVRKAWEMYYRAKENGTLEESLDKGQEDAKPEVLLLTKDVGVEDELLLQCVLTRLSEECRQTPEMLTLFHANSEWGRREICPTPSHPLIQLFDALSPRQRDCLILQCYFGFSQNEIANMLHISMGTVGSHTSDARDKMGKLLTATIADNHLTCQQIAADLNLTEKTVQELMQPAGRKTRKRGNEDAKPTE